MWYPHFLSRYQDSNPKTSHWIPPEKRYRARDYYFNRDPAKSMQISKQQVWEACKNLEQGDAVLKECQAACTAVANVPKMLPQISFQ